MADGKFNFSLKCGETYKIKGDRLGYFESESQLIANQINGFENIVVLALDEKEFITVDGKEMLNIATIKFELNKSTITKTSKVELAKVARLMNKFPNMVIEFGAHTDSRAPDGYNMQLSRRRSQETVNYLLALGVDYKRITGKGYGESKLLNKCSNGVKCSELEHQENRRTEFLVIRK